MALRNFVSQDITQLQKTLAALEKARQGGSLIELRVSGIMTRNSNVSQQELALLYNQCRYELFLRVNALADADESKAALVAQFGSNPYREKAMKVHSRSSVGVFGYPLPAPTVPPTP